MKKKRFIGVDLHKNCFTACFYENQKKKETKEYAMAKMKDFIKELRKDDRVAVEATTNTRFFVNQVKDSVKEVKVINPHQFKVISDSVKKTDKEDAEQIAFFLSKGMIPEVKLKEKKYIELESLSNTRDKLVKLRTSLKNKIHNILNAQGIITKRESLNSEKQLKKVLEYSVSEVAKIEIEVILDQVRNLERGIKRLEEKMVEEGKKLEGYKNLKSIKGIGEKSAVILLSSIGEIKNFESEKKLSAYFGMVPKVSQSNTSSHYGKITKRGNKLARTTLVQCALVSIKYSEYLKRFYLKLKAKKGSGKAIIATARKLLGIVYKTLVNNWVFEDFPNFKIKTSC